MYHLLTHRVFRRPTLKTQNLLLKYKKKTQRDVQINLGPQMLASACILRTM